MFAEKAQKIWVEKHKYETTLNQILIEINKKFNTKIETNIKIKGIEENKEEIIKNLINSEQKDQEKKITTTGPQKDQVQYRLNGVEIKHSASQGEKSLFFFYFKTSRGGAYKNNNKKRTNYITR